MAEFGPGSARPFLFCQSGQLSADTEKFVRNLPCPVIALGAPDAAPWADCVIETSQALAQIADNIRRAPFTAMILVQHLRASEQLDIASALTAESLAYAALQQGPEFMRWRAEAQEGALPPEPGLPLLIDSDHEALTLTLNRPASLNAIGTEMRDALCEGFTLAASGAFSALTLRANGRAFSVGGAVEEFGVISDPASAHYIRSVRLPARILSALEIETRAEISGAAIGAGIEIAAFCRVNCASEQAWFQLPELKYGLIPGAGGTVSIARRIGRQRTAFMALSMKKIRARRALKWGLIDEVF